MVKNYLEFINEQKLHIQNGQDNDIKKEFPDYDKSKYGHQFIFIRI